MHVSKLAMVNRIVDARLALKRQLDEIAGGCLRVTVAGGVVAATVLGDEIVALVKPMVERELKAQIKALEADLEQMGVVVDR